MYDLDRTYDEVTLPTARRLFERARTPLQMSRLTKEEIDGLIRTCTFHERKASQIKVIAQRLLDEYDGDLPCDLADFAILPRVGPKCAHLVLGVACDQPFISVDIHVHRVTNRWGYVQTSTPEKTMLALEEKLPRDIGSRSTACLCHLENTFAQAIFQSVQSVPCSICVSRWA